MKPHCERTIGFRARSDGWGSEPIHCKRTVAVSAWTDSAGHVHYGCADHRAVLIHRYPAVTESEAMNR